MAKKKYIPSVISVKNIKKEFKEYKRDAGIIAAAKSLFSREYTTKHALKGVSMNVKKGEVIGFIGPNGAGKSTLIKILTGVLHPSSGEVQCVGYIPWEQRIKYVQHAGVIFGQKSQLWWDIPAIDTFELHKHLYGIPEREFKKRLENMIKKLDIGSFVGKQVRQLSLGERMRCELVLALLHKPKLVFLDEPTIGLDAIAKDKIRQFVKEFNRKYGTTFIVTTHDMSDIEHLCKRVVIINHGTIIYDGPLNDIKKKFANKKIIECTFSTPIIKTYKLKGMEIIKQKQYRMTAELDLSKCKVRKAVDHIIKRYGDWEDIDIRDPPIEEIIKLIYKKRKAI
ncbi:ATP-binding cassette domain-containing protein [Nanoarchaeota archaeon]